MYVPFSYASSLISQLFVLGISQFRAMGLFLHLRHLPVTVTALMSQTELSFAKVAIKCIHIILLTLITFKFMQNQITLAIQTT